jgi:hypothetical protein
MLVAVIARIVLVLSLVLLVAAPAGALAGSVQIELVEDAASAADDEAVAPIALAHAASPASHLRQDRSEEIAPAAPAIGRVFRPPRRVA